MEQRPESDSDLLREVLRRLDRIEQRLDLLEAPSFSRARAPESSPAPPLRSEPLPAASPQPTAAPFALFGSTAANGEDTTAKDRSLGIETQVGLTWANRIGAITVIFGVAFFFKYAVDRGLITETGRVLVGLAAGVLALLSGEWLYRRNHRVYGQGITGLGMAVLYLSIYAASSFYRLVPNSFASVLMLGITGLAVALSLRYNAVAIAALGLTGGYLSPFLLSREGSWLNVLSNIVLTGGGLLLLKRKPWTKLQILLIVGSCLLFPAPFELVWWRGAICLLVVYALYWALATSEALVVVQFLAMGGVWLLWPPRVVPMIGIRLAIACAGLVASDRRKSRLLGSVSFVLFWLALPFVTSEAFSFGAILTAAMIIFFVYAYWIFKGPDEPPRKPFSHPAWLVLASNAPFFFLGCRETFSRLTPAQLGMLAAGLAVVQVILARLLWSDSASSSIDDAEAREEVDLQPAHLSLGLALAFLTLAVPLYFDSFRITIFWAVEGAVISWAAARVRSSRLQLGAFGLAILVVFRLLFFDAESLHSQVEPHALIANPRFLTFCFAALGFWFSAKWTASSAPRMLLVMAGHLSLIGAGLLEIADWAASSATSHDSFLMVASSILLAVYGTILVSLGVARRSPFDRVFGLVLFALVVLKLYLYDVWQLEQTFRIVAFVVLGILLLAASFLYSRFRGTLERLLRR